MFLAKPFASILLLSSSLFRVVPPWLFVSLATLVIELALAGLLRRSLKGSLLLQELGNNLLCNLLSQVLHIWHEGFALSSDKMPLLESPTSAALPREYTRPGT